MILQQNSRSRRTFVGRILVGCVALVTVVTGLGAAPAAASVDSAAPVVLPASNGSSPANIYGFLVRTKDGRTLSYTYENPADAPTVDPEAVIGFCYFGAGNISYNGRFNWSTFHSCSGNYGLVTHQSRMLRSSWSGYRAYNDWSSRGPTAYAAWTYYWSMYCKGGGTYDYKGSVRIYASGIGYWSGVAASNNSVRQACGV